MIDLYLSKDKHLGIFLQLKKQQTPIQNHQMIYSILSQVQTMQMHSISVFAPIYTQLTQSIHVNMNIQSQYPQNSAEGNNEIKNRFHHQKYFVKIINLSKELTQMFIMIMILLKVTLSKNIERLYQGSEISKGNQGIVVYGSSEKELNKVKIYTFISKSLSSWYDMITYVTFPDYTELDEMLDILTNENSETR